MPDRHHEIPQEEPRRDLELSDAYYDGKIAAIEGDSPWECPYYATDEFETEKVREWYKGFYAQKNIFNKKS